MTTLLAYDHEGFVVATQEIKTGRAQNARRVPARFVRNTEGCSYSVLLWNGEEQPRRIIERGGRYYTRTLRREEP